MRSVQRRWLYVFIILLAFMVSAAALASPAPALVSHAAPAENENVLPPPATLQTSDQWVLPAVTGPGWVTIPTEPEVATEPPPAPAPPPVVQEGPIVVGYYAEDWDGDLRGLKSLQTAGRQLDRAVNFALQLNADGSITTRSYPALMAEAGEMGIPVYGLVHNMTAESFSAGVARAVLADPARRSRAVAEMLQIARAQGLAGIDIDIENVPGDLRPQYTALVEEAAAVLRPAGLRLSISVPAKVWDDRTSNWGGAFDYQALGPLVDNVAIMTYDEHSWGLPAGPIASLGWVDAVARYASSQIEPQKILLGIATFGYDWLTGTRQVTRGLSSPGAVELAAKYGATVEWDEEAQVPCFHYWKDGAQHTVYYENSYSAGFKLGLVEKWGLGGIAVWRLGLDDAGLWPVIERGL